MTAAAERCTAGGASADIRYTSYVRSILEHAAQGGPLPDMAEISKRLERN
jgi:hypothetical protein